MVTAIRNRSKANISHLSADNLQQEELVEMVVAKTEDTLAIKTRFHFKTVNLKTLVSLSPSALEFDQRPL